MAIHYEPHRCLSTRGKVFPVWSENVEFTDDPEEVTCGMCLRWLRVHPVLSKCDLDQVAETARGLKEGRSWCEYCSEERGEPTGCEGDCYSSEIIMTSIGYVDVWYDADQDAGMAAGVVVEL